VAFLCPQTTDVCALADWFGRQILILSQTTQTHRDDTHAVCTRLRWVHQKWFQSGSDLGSNLGVGCGVRGAEGYRTKTDKEREREMILQYTYLLGTRLRVPISNLARTLDRTRGTLIYLKMRRSQPVCAALFSTLTMDDFFAQQRCIYCIVRLAVVLHLLGVDPKTRPIVYTKKVPEPLMSYRGHKVARRSDATPLPVCKLFEREMINDPARKTGKIRLQYVLN